MFWFLAPIYLARMRGTQGLRSRASALPNDTVGASHVQVNAPDVQ